MLRFLKGLYEFFVDLFLDYFRCYRWYIFPFLFWLTVKYIQGQEDPLRTALLFVCALLFGLLLAGRVYRRKRNEETEGR